MPASVRIAPKKAFNADHHRVSNQVGRNPERLGCVSRYQGRPATVQTAGKDRADVGQASAAPYCPCPYQSTERYPMTKDNDQFRIVWNISLACVHCKSSFSFGVWLQIIEAKIVCPNCGRVDIAAVSIHGATGFSTAHGIAEDERR